MKKSIGISFDKKIISDVKNSLDQDMGFARVVRHFILNEYKLPSDFSLIVNDKPSEIKKEPIRLETDCINLLDYFVEEIAAAGYKSNRSLVMRHIFKELLIYLKSKPVLKNRKVHSSFYFEQGTREIFDRLISHRDRSSTIESFILNEYKPSKDEEQLKEKPKVVEPMRINIDETAYEIIGDYLEEFSGSKISRNALMRDVISQLIQKLSNRNYKELLLEQQLDTAVYQYKTALGEDKIAEKLADYLKDRKE